MNYLRRVDASSARGFGLIEDVRAIFKNQFVNIDDAINSRIDGKREDQANMVADLPVLETGPVPGFDLCATNPISARIWL